MCVLVTGVQTCALPISCKNDLVFDVKANTFQGVSGRGDRLQRNSANGKSSTWCYFLIAELHFVGRGQKQRSLKTLCYLSGTGKVIGVNMSFHYVFHRQIVLPYELLINLYREGGIDDNSFFLRSEEHTSELQSLMRNSYATF